MRTKDPRAQIIEDGLTRHSRSMRWLAQQVGMSPAGLGYLLREGVRPRDETIYDRALDIIKKLDADAAALQLQTKGMQMGPSPDGTMLPRLRVAVGGKIKIYGAVSAGDGNTSSIDAAEMDIPMQFAREDYGGLVVEGDSMEPFLKPSDVVIFRDWTHPKPGHVVAACTGAGEWVVKLMVFENGAYKLRSLNPKYPDIESDFKMTGFLVGIVRDHHDDRWIRLNARGLNYRSSVEEG